MLPEPARRLAAMKLPIHGTKASVLFKEGQGYRVAMTGGKHQHGDLVTVVPGVNMVLKYFVGGSNPDPGDPPREHLWLAVQEGHKLEEELIEEAPDTSTIKRAQAAGVIPVRHRNKKKSLAA